MSARKISQREARRLRQRVQRFEDVERERLSRWGKNYPGGTNFLTLTLDSVSAAKADTAQLLGAAIVGRMHDGKLYLYAVPPLDGRDPMP